MSETALTMTARDLSLLKTPEGYDEQIAHGFRPRTDLKPYLLGNPIDWAADPFDDRNWQMVLHSWQPQSVMLRRWFSKKDPAYLREAFDLALDWKRYHDNRPPTDMSWYDMPTGSRVHKHADDLSFELFEGDLPGCPQMIHELATPGRP